MAYRSTNPQLRKAYETMLKLAADTTSELYHEGFQRSGAGHRAAFWDGYNGVSPTPHVIPGTLSAACAAAGRDFRRQQKGADPVPHGKGYPKRVGRPELPQEERRERFIRIRATEAEEAKFDRLGGAEWFRGVLKRAKET